MLSPCPVCVRSSDGRPASAVFSAPYLTHGQLKTAGQLLSRPPEKRKVAGSIPALATEKIPGSLIHVDVKKLGRIPNGGEPRSPGAAGVS